jgi:hypothetical protein
MTDRSSNDPGVSPRYSAARNVSAVTAQARFDHIYVMGAGRSGTTLLSVLIGGHPAAGVRGELLHFPEYWAENRACSCGLGVRDCPHWKAAGSALGGGDPHAVAAARRIAQRAERHRNVLAYLLAPPLVPGRYLSQLEALFTGFGGSGAVIDASKYVARALALRRLRTARVGYVYIVRDGRGVLHSFSKPVQRPKPALAAAAYYVLVNGAAQLAAWTWLRGRVVKVRYEDLIVDPVAALGRIGDFVGFDLRDVARRVVDDEPIEIGHMVSGNRFRTRGMIKVGADEEWRRLPPLTRFWYHLLCLPIQLVNGYRL